MFARSSSGPAIAAPSTRNSNRSDVDAALTALLVRMRQRQYPETTPVLASFWLKTVWDEGNDLKWWRSLDRLLARAVQEESLNEFSREALIDIQTWIQKTVLVTGRTGPGERPKPDPVEKTLDFDWLAPYVARLLNEWMPAEVARLLVNDSIDVPPDNGIPVLAKGRAIENLLVRARLSVETLEMLFRPELLSPQWVYPADVEMLRDVALAQLGKTEAPPHPVLPAAPLCLAQHSPLAAADYQSAVRQAALVTRPDGGEEIHVPIGPAQAAAIVNSEQVHIGSVIVTMDGRWWESKSLQTGQRHSVIHVPAGRLRIDYSADHAKFVIPCEDAAQKWSGEITFPDAFEMFGREWRASGWEQDGEHAWFHLTYSRNLRIDEIAPAAAARVRKLRPASVDIAWSALENALAASLAQKSREPVERLYHSELIPLGRALSSLMESVLRSRLRKGEALDTQLRAVGYFAAQLSAEYGRTPWRILPPPVRAALLRSRLQQLHEIFDGVAEKPGNAGEKASAVILRALSPSKAA